METTRDNLFAAGLFFSMAMAFTGYSTADDGSFTVPITLSEKIGGEWAINSVVQIGEANAHTKTLTDLLDFNTFVIDLDQDGAGSPSAFTVEGSAPFLLSTSGIWKVDYNLTKNDNALSQLLLNDGKAETVLIIMVVPGNTKTLEYRSTCKTSSQPFVSYTYNLTQTVK